MKKKVAVIMSIYKHDVLPYFIDAVESILNQSYPCDLFIYRDGCVSESIQSYLDSISSLPQVKCVYSPVNEGLAVALNCLIDKVVELDYEYVARMDSDDLSRANRIEKQVFYFNQNINVDLCGTSCREFGASFSLEEKHLPCDHESLLDFSISRCPFIHPSVMFRSKVFRDGVRYPTDTAFTEDMALWFSLLRKGYRFGNVKEVLLDYRLNEKTIFRRKGLKKG